jgi:hypothetical protein
MDYIVLAINQLTKNMHWPCYWTVHVYVVIHVSDSMRASWVDADMFFHCLFICIAVWGLSTISEISTKRTTISHLKSLNTKITTTYCVRNQGPGLGQAHTFGGVKLVRGIINSSLDKIGPQTAIHINKQWKNISASTHEARMLSLTWMTT